MIEWWCARRRTLRQRLDKIEALIVKNGDDIMALGILAQSIVDAVAAERTQTASAIALLTQLNDLIQAARNPEDLAALQQAAADLVADTALVAAAVTQNTPVV